MSFQVALNPASAFDPHYITVRCKFCGCTEETPCAIALRPLPAFSLPEIVPCTWLILFGEPAREIPFREGFVCTAGIDPRDNICINPDCVRKAYDQACAKILNPNF